MIVRILGEGQYDVPDDRVGALNDLDEVIVEAVESGDHDAYRDELEQLLAAIRTAGTPLPLDALEPSDLVLPGADASLDEVRALLGDEGLIAD